MWFRSYDLKLLIFVILRFSFIVHSLTMIYFKDELIFWCFNFYSEQFYSKQSGFKTLEPGPVEHFLSHRDVMYTHGFKNHRAFHSIFVFEVTRRMLNISHNFEAGSTII